jgi:hypothetical protein
MDAITRQSPPRQSIQRGQPLRISAPVFEEEVIESHFAGSLAPDMGRPDCCDKLDNAEELVHCIEQ